MKDCNCIVCSFCVSVSFDRIDNAYIVTSCRVDYEGRVANHASIVGHVKFESDLSNEEKDQLNNFGKIGYTGSQPKSGLIRLFENRTYYSDMIYRVVKKARDEQVGNTTGCMLKLVDLGILTH